MIKIRTKNLLTSTCNSCAGSNAKFAVSAETRGGAVTTHLCEDCFKGLIKASSDAYVLCKTTGVADVTSNGLDEQGNEKA